MVKLLCFKLILIWKMVHATKDLEMVIPSNITADYADLEKCLNVNFKVEEQKVADTEVLQKCIALFISLRDSSDTGILRKSNMQFTSNGEDSNKDIGILEGTNASYVEMKQAVLNLQKFTTSETTHVQNTTASSFSTNNVNIYENNITKDFNSTSEIAEPLLFTGISIIQNYNTTVENGTTSSLSLLTRKLTTNLEVSVSRSFITTTPAPKIRRTTTEILNSLHTDVNMITAMLELQYTSTHSANSPNSITTTGTTDQMISSAPKPGGLNLVFVKSHTLPPLNTPNNYLQYAAKKLEQIERRSFTFRNFRRFFTTKPLSPEQKRQMFVIARKSEVPVKRRQILENQMKIIPKKQAAKRLIENDNSYIIYAGHNLLEVGHGKSKNKLVIPTQHPRFKNNLTK